MNRKSQNLAMAQREMSKEARIRGKLYDNTRRNAMRREKCDASKFIQTLFRDDILRGRKRPVSGREKHCAAKAKSFGRINERELRDTAITMLAERKEPQKVSKVISILNEVILFLS